jgi:RNA polymerase sigma-70 factor (ECF subfamily)
LGDAAPGDAVDAPAALSDSVALSLDLERALALLSAAEHDAIVHCYFADLSHAQAAEIMGWPLGTLKTHVLRAKIKLKAALSAWAPEAKEERVA